MAKTARNPIELPTNNVVTSSPPNNTAPPTPDVVTRDVPASEATATAEAATPPEDEIEIVVRKVPVAFGELPEISNSKRLTIGTFKFDSIRQSQTFRRLREGLNRKSVRMSNGRHIQSQADVFRYLIEQLESEVA